MVSRYLHMQPHSHRRDLSNTSLLLRCLIGIYFRFLLGHDLDPKVSFEARWLVFPPELSSSPSYKRTTAMVRYCTMKHGVHFNYDALQRHSIVIPPEHSAKKGLPSSFSQSSSRVQHGSESGPHVPIRTLYYETAQLPKLS